MTNKNNALPVEAIDFPSENGVHIAVEHSSEIADLSSNFNAAIEQKHSDLWGKRTKGREEASESPRFTRGERPERNRGGPPPKRAAPYNRGAPKTRKFYKVTPQNADEYLWARVAIGAPAHCWPWIGSLDNNGYGQARFGGKPQIASRLAYALSTGQDITGLLVCHHCDNPACCNPSHLYAGTSFDNVRDMHQRGRARPPSGERNHFAKLSAEQVENIRRLFGQGMTNIAIGKLMGVHHSTISKIRTGHSW